MSIANFLVGERRPRLRVIFGLILCDDHRDPFPERCSRATRGYPGWKAFPHNRRTPTFSTSIALPLKSHLVVRSTLRGLHLSCSARSTKRPTDVAFQRRGAILSPAEPVQIRRRRALHQPIFGGPTVAWPSASLASGRAVALSRCCNAAGLPCR